MSWSGGGAEDEKLRRWEVGFIRLRKGQVCSRFSVESENAVEYCETRQYSSQETGGGYSGRDWKRSRNASPLVMYM